MISIVYLKVVSKADSSAPDPSYYDQFTRRFVKTYVEFKPKIPHRLVAVCCGGKRTPHTESFFDGLKVDYETYIGSGWDNGAFQEIGRKAEDDILVCCATPVYFWREDWLSKIADAFEKENGRGIFGPMASLQRSPHLRTSCFAFHPDMMRWYPNLILNRKDCISFESGDWNFSMWSRLNGFPVIMVSADGYYPFPEWRKPSNIFRRGDQSNCLVRDRHWDIYDSASDDGKRKLELEADGY